MDTLYAQDSITAEKRAIGPKRFLDARRVRHLVVLSPSSLTRLEKVGQFPARYHLGPARVAWAHADIITWMQSKIDARGPCPLCGEPAPLTSEDRFIGKAELRDLIVYSTQHIRVLEIAGSFPKRIWIGEKRVAWLECIYCLGFKWIIKWYVCCWWGRCCKKYWSK